MIPNSPISADRIAADINALAAITEPGRPWTRRAFTPMFFEGRAWLEKAMREAGAVTRVDAAGNLVGTIPGRQPGLGTIMLGSHSDTVPDGGRFDGIAGVVVALEVARALRDQGVVLEHNLEVVDFLASTLTNRLLHGPSQRLREAAERGEVELLEAARILFAADAPDQT